MSITFVSTRNDKIMYLSNVNDLHEKRENEHSKYMGEVFGKCLQ